MLIDVRNLRRDLPVWDTPELAEKWEEILATLARINELDVPCAMGVQTRRMLCETILAMGATDVLDIGTYVGTSATAHGRARNDSGHPRCECPQRLLEKGGPGTNPAPAH